MREQFLTQTPPFAVPERLRRSHPEFRSLDLYLRAAEGVERVFVRRGPSIDVVVHREAQPSHD